MELIFEKSTAGHKCSILPPCDVPKVELNSKRSIALSLPEVSENELSRHYTELAENTHGVNNGFYPLGSCTMKYNPSVDEDIAALPEFTSVHPLAPDETVQGSLTVLSEMEKVLMAITGFAGFTFEPAAGAHGEFTGLLTIKAYHRANGDLTTRT